LLSGDVCLSVRRCAAEGFDIQKPAVSEAVLLQAPVRAVSSRLAALLQEWPDHPLLLQLAALCSRLLGARIAHQSASSTCGPARPRVSTWQGGQSRLAGLEVGFGTSRDVPEAAARIPHSGWRHPGVDARSRESPRCAAQSRRVTCPAPVAGV
jgi:hypothetical protein